MRRSKFRKRFLTVVLLFNVFFIGILYISSYHTTNRIKLFKKNQLLRNKTLSRRNHTSSLDKGRDEIIILFWTKYFKDDPFRSMESLQRTQQSQPKCFEKCRVVTDRDHLGVSDALVFHSRDMRRNDMPPVHPNNQLWIYFQRESPSNTHADLSEYANVFNWTMTYRRDSDVYFPYGHVSKRNGSHGHLDKDLNQERKLVLWIVSNCYTKGKRERLVEELERFIPIDIYGDCGDYPCTREKKGCLPQLAPQYKFYLSFENSLCSDYATEKLFEIFNYDLVPVVYGGADYDALAPPNSFINVNKFDSPEALAIYLKYLDKNPEKYREYLKWKHEYKVEIVNDASWFGWCNLCGKLKEQRLHPQQKIYGNIWKWWNYIKPIEPVQNNYVDFNLSANYDEQKLFSFPEGNYVPVCQDYAFPKSGSYDIFHSLPFRKLKRWYYKVRGY